MHPFVVPMLVVRSITSVPALAQPPDTGCLEELTWTELRDLIHAGTTIVTVLVEGVEQSGPDIAIGKHDARARILSERIAREMGDTLVAPVVAYVPEGNGNSPTSPMRFPETITMLPNVFRLTLESAAGSLELQGLKDTVLIGQHESYQSNLAKVAVDLNPKWPGSQIRAQFVPEYYRAATIELTAVLRGHGYSAEEVGTHAGVADILLTMAVASGYVRQDGLKTGVDLDATHNVYGDLRRSSAEMGGLEAEGIVWTTVAAISAALKRSSSL